MSDFNFLAGLLAQPATLTLAMLAVVAAYTVFTLVGFGSALFAGGPLTLLMPVARSVPLLAMLDCGGSVRRGWLARRHVDRPALQRLIPGMLLGQLLGVALLARLPAAPLAAALGLFIISQGLRGLLAKKGENRPSGRRALASGLFGGVLGGLFGSGGFVYASYLERHLASREAFRATQAVLIALSTAWRIVLCLSLGLLDLQLLLTACAFLPAMAAGVWLGQHIDLKISREQLARLLNLLLIASGASLLVRFAL